VDQQNYIQVRNSQINYYRTVPLFYQTDTDSCVLYKPAGTSLPEMRISQQRHPLLYIHEEDRIVAIKELQKGFSKQIEKSISTGDAVNVKVSLCDLVEETLDEPRSGTLKALPETVDSLIAGYSEHPEMLKSIASIVGQLLGIIDCYEALTNEDRPYRRAREPLETLKFLKDDVQAGIFNRDIFEKFCYSLI